MANRLRPLSNATSRAEWDDRRVYSPGAFALPLATGLLLSFGPVPAPEPASAPPAASAIRMQAESPLPSMTPTPAGSPAPPAAAGFCVTNEGIERARAYVRHRPGNVSFAVLERGVIRSERGGVPYRSASLVKAMLLAAELRSLATHGKWTDPGIRARHRAMIVHSDNKAASATFERVGTAGLYRVARSVGMRRFRNGGYWGLSELTASDQVRFWRHLNVAVPRRFHDYARELLGSIEPAQTWGLARVVRRKGFKTVFKAGWLPQPGGWLVHQGLRLVRGHCTIGIAVLTSQQPDMSAGIETMRGVAERLL